MRTLIIIIICATMFPMLRAQAIANQGWMDEAYYFPPYESYFISGWDSDGNDFGDFFYDEETGMLYHPKTASEWWVFGDSPDSLYMYGPRIARWVWTGRGIWPWMYFFDSHDHDIIPRGWGYIVELEVRPDGEIWARMKFQSSTVKTAVTLPF